MFRITVHDAPESLTFQLEGKLVGPWVREAEICHERTMAREPKPVERFDLTGVTLIDAAGKAFLSAMHAQGAKFVAAGCLMNAIVAEITGAPTGYCALSGRKPDTEPKEQPWRPC